MNKKKLAVIIAVVVIIVAIVAVAALCGTGVIDGSNAGTLTAAGSLAN